MGWAERLRWPKSPEAVEFQAELDEAIRPKIYEAPPASADPDWVLAKQFIRQRLVSCRRQLEAVELDLPATEGMRYAILELEGVLNFQKPSNMLGNDGEQ